MKDVYIVQPFELGSKKQKYKPLAVIIPSKVVKECQIDTATGFALQIDNNTKRMKMFTIEVKDALSGLYDEFQ